MGDGGGFEFGLGFVDGGVDGEGHAETAVGCGGLLTAVEPFFGVSVSQASYMIEKEKERRERTDGSGDVDHHHSLWRWVGCAVQVSQESGIEGSSACKGGTRSAKGGSGCSVVFLGELEEDQVADIGFDGIGSIYFL